MGVAIGTVVHSQVAALVGTLVWIFLGETLLSGLFARSTPTASTSTCRSRRSTAQTGRAAKTCSTTGPHSRSRLGWIALLGAAGVWRTRRRDIT